MICDNITAAGARLRFAGRDAGELARKYGTPLYLMDEARLRQNCRVYRESMAAGFARSLPLYASKALACKRVYEIIAEEGLGADVVSAGEIALAKSAGFPMEKVFFHGSAKTDSEIAYAMDAGVGFLILDGMEELSAAERLAADRGREQRVLLRLTPGIDPHTFEAVATGQVDSKFGVSVETGAAMDFARAALSAPHLTLMGFHAHVGSQVFDSAVFYDTADIMLRFMAEVKDRTGYEAELLNLGGGYGVRYTESDPTVDIAAEIASVAEHIHGLCGELGLREPMVLLEPGRSIAADAGMTLYTVQAVKDIPGCRRYVSVDGGMTDNPRYALYRAAYTVLAAEHMEEPAEGACTIAGRCCESGDMIQENVPLPPVARGDIIAVCTTGAYNYAMASNYNAVPRPPIVMLDGDRDYVAVRRETIEDLLGREMG